MISLFLCYDVAQEYRQDRLRNFSSAVYKECRVASTTLQPANYYRWMLSHLVVSTGLVDVSKNHLDFMVQPRNPTQKLQVSSRAQYPLVY